MGDRSCEHIFTARFKAWTMRIGEWRVRWKIGLVDGEWCGEDGNVVDKDGRSIHRTESDWESERRLQPGTRTCDHRRAEERYRGGGHEALRVRGAEGGRRGARNIREKHGNKRKWVGRWKLESSDQ